LPGETVLIAASVYAGAGRLNVVVVGLIGFIAAVIGDNIGFAIGHYGGRALVLRWGRHVRLTEERLDKAEAFFNHHGAWIITVARFIEGLRQANGLIAGTTGMRWLRFLVFNALGAALWVGTWVSLGYLAGSHIGTIYHYIGEYSTYLLIALVVVHVAGVAVDWLLTGDNLVKAMLTGRKRLPAAAATGEGRTAPLWRAAILAVLALALVAGLALSTDYTLTRSSLAQIAGQP